MKAPIINREQALKNQVRKAQDLIRQFEDGTGRHNSNLIGSTHDSGARINVDALGALTRCDIARRLSQAIYSRATAEAVRLGLIDPDLHTWEEHGVKPLDDLEIHLLNRGLLRGRPQDCDIGQVVRLEAIDRNPRQRWASVSIPIGPVTYDDGNETFPAQAVTRFEFERVKFCYISATREFWKRVA